MTFINSAITGSPQPAFAARVASVGGSPVRDILAVTARPEVVNFAGDCPLPVSSTRKAWPPPFTPC